MGALRPTLGLTPPLSMPRPPRRTRDRARGLYASNRSGLPSLCQVFPNRKIRYIQDAQDRIAGMAVACFRVIHGPVAQSPQRRLLHLEGGKLCCLLPAKAGSSITRAFVSAMDEYAC